MTRRTFSTLTAAAAFADEAKRIRVAMIGTGHGHAASKIRALRSMPEFELVGLAEPDSPADRGRDPFRGSAWLSREQILNDRSIELVALEAADPDTNLANAELSVKAGKFVHLDKPPGSDLTRFRKLLHDAALQKLVVQQGYQWRYHPAMRAAVEAAHNGWLGTVYKFRASIDKLIQAEERAHLARYAGGMMFSEGCHLIDRAVHVLGKPQAVTSFLRHDSAIADGLKDNSLVVLEYEKAIAEVSLAGFDPGGTRRRHLEIFGTNGSVRVQPYVAPYRLTVDLRDPAGPYKAGEQKMEFQEPPPGIGYTPDFHEMFRVIRQGAKPEFSVEHDLITHETLLRACRMLKG